MERQGMECQGMERQGMDAMDGRQSMDARAWKEPEGYRVDAPQQLN